MAKVEAAAPLPAGPINEADAKRLLGAAGVSFAPEKTARTREEAVAAAKEVGFPVVLKVLSPDIAHKSEAGGVVLGLQNADDVAAGYDAMMARVREREPKARIDGALVARMIEGGTEDGDRHQARSDLRAGGDVRARRRLRRGAEGRDACGSRRSTRKPRNR